MSDRATDDKLGDVSSILWWIGWNPKWVIVLGVLLFVVGGLLIWLVGLLYVNHSYRSVQEEYVELVDRRRTTIADNVSPGVQCFTLVGEDPSWFFYSPSEEYRATHLLVGEGSVTIQSGIRMAMRDRLPEVRDTGREIFYDQISSVTYDAPYLIVNTSDGDSVKYLSGRKPDDALNELKTRIRAYKSE